MPDAANHAGTCPHHGDGALMDGTSNLDRVHLDGTSTLEFSVLDDARASYYKRHLQAFQ